MIVIKVESRTIMRLRFVILAFIAILSTAAAAETVCNGQFGYKSGSFQQEIFHFDDQITWKYEVVTTNSKWESEPLPIHGSTRLNCVGCGFYKFVGGSYGLYSNSDAGESGHLTPTKLDQRINQTIQSYSNGWGSEVFEEEHLSLVASRDDIDIGPLSGYAVLYRFTDKAVEEIRSLRSNYWLARFLPGLFNPDGLLIITVSNGCILFDISFKVPILEHDEWSILNSFLDGVSINRTQLP